MSATSSEDADFAGLTWPDYLVIAIYFVCVLAVGIYSSWKSKRDSVEGYFLSSRNMGFVLVGASLFGSNIGSGHFVGLAGTAAASGIAISMFELTAVLYGLMLGWIFVPVYLSSGVFTMPEYLGRRFGGQRIRVYLSVLSLLLYVFTKISADLFAGALFITQATQLKGEWAIYVAVVVMLAIACVFTVAGGLTAVIWTDFVQVVLMLVGACFVTVAGFRRTGGYAEMISRFFEATAENRSLADPADPGSGLCGAVPADAMHLFRSPEPGASDLPWTGLTFGLAISAIWYVCTDQVMVQRTLASKSILHAKAGTIFYGYLKLTPLWLMVFPGMAARVLFPNEVACASPEACMEICNSKSGCTNVAFVMLVNHLLPTGMRGLMLAVMLAALMSSLTSIFNSSATIFTMDIYTKIRKSAGERELLLAGRTFVVVLVALSVLWLPVISAAQGSRLFDYIQAITSYLAPPVCAVFLLAVLWPRCNERGAFWSLAVGLAVGLARFVVEFGFPAPPCGSADPRPPAWWRLLVGRVHYLHFGFLLWALCTVVAAAVSLATEPIPREELAGLTYWTLKQKKSIPADKSSPVRKFSGTTAYYDLKKERSKAYRLPRAKLCLDPTCRGRHHLDKSSGEEWWREEECGAKKRREEEEEEEDKEDHGHKDVASLLHEDRRWKWVVEINAVVIMSIATFVMAFYY